MCTNNHPVFLLYSTCLEVRNKAWFLYTDLGRAWSISQQSVNSQDLVSPVPDSWTAKHSLISVAPSFPPLASPSPRSSLAFQTPCWLWRKKAKKVLYKDPRLPPNIHMVSDSCLPRLSHPHTHSLSRPHTASASLNRTDYNRRDPHSSAPHTTPISIQILHTTFTKATKRANYCKTSLITFQPISSLQTAKQQ